MAAIDAAKSKAVVVYLSTKKDSQSDFPKAVQGLISSPEAGKFIPKLALTDSAASEPIGVISYKALKADARDALRDVFKAAEPEEEAVSKVSFSPESWTSADGRELTATFRSLSGDQVTLILEKGTSTSLPLSRLSAKSQERAKECAGSTGS